MHFQKCHTILLFVSRSWHWHYHQIRASSSTRVQASLVSPKLCWLRSQSKHPWIGKTEMLRPHWLPSLASSTQMHTSKPAQVCLSQKTLWVPARSPLINLRFVKQTDHWLVFAQFSVMTAPLLHHLNSLLRQAWSFSDTIPPFSLRNLGGNPAGFTSRAMKKKKIPRPRQG